MFTYSCSKSSKRKGAGHQSGSHGSGSRRTQVILRMTVEMKSGSQPVYPELLWKLEVIQRRTRSLGDIVGRLFGLKTMSEDAKDIVMNGRVVVREDYGGSQERRYSIKLEGGEAHEIIDAIYAQITSEDGTVKAEDLLKKNLKELLIGRDRTGRYELLV